MTKEYDLDEGMLYSLIMQGCICGEGIFRVDYQTESHRLYWRLDKTEGRWVQPTLIAESEVPYLVSCRSCKRIWWTKEKGWGAKEE